MATEIIEHLVIRGDDHIPDVVFYLNSMGDIFVGEEGVQSNFFFVIKKSDWEDMKKFIDEKFKSNT